jgi:hypothetical protein
MNYRFTLNNAEKGTIVLQNEPMGVEDMQVQIERQSITHGVMVNSIVDLKFYCGAGKEFIDECYEMFGADAEVSILIERNCGCIGILVAEGDYNDDYNNDYGVSDGADCDWETFFFGRLDYATWKEIYINGKLFTEIDVEPTSIYSKLNSRFETDVDILNDISVDGVQLPTLDKLNYEFEYHGKAIVQENVWGLTDIGFPYCDSTSGAFYIYWTPPLGLIQEEMLGGNSPTTFIQYSLSFPQGSPIQEFLIAPSTGSYDLKVKLKGSIKINDFDDIKLYVVVNGSATELYNVGSSGGSYIPFDIDVVETLSLTTGDYVYVYFSTFATNIALVPCYTFESGSMSIELTTAVESFSLGRANLIHEITSRVAGAILDNPTPIYSELLGRTDSQPTAYLNNGEASFTNVINGLGIRNFPLVKGEKTMFANLKQLFDGMNMIWNVGMGIEGDVLRIEPKRHFYNPNALIQLMNVPDIKVSIAKDYLFSKASFGNSNWKIKDVNGIDEVNTRRDYNTGLVSLKKDYLQNANIVTGAYAIEATRREKYSTSGTSDTDYDNDIFFIATKRDIAETYKAEKNENFADIQNLYSPETTYNLRFTPTRNLIRHLPMLNSSMYKYTGKQFKLAYGEGNYKAISTQTDNVAGNYKNASLSENIDLVWSSTDQTDILFIPEYYEFEYPLTFQQYNIIKDNPYNAISFSNNQTNFKKGYIVDIKYKAISGLTSFKLIRAYE